MQPGLLTPHDRASPMQNRPWLTPSPHSGPGTALSGAVSVSAEAVAEAVAEEEAAAREHHAREAAAAEEVTAVKAAAKTKMHKSVEIGQEKDDDELPLPTSCCASFSCHGIDDDHDKVNQDCACIAFPLKGDTSTGLFVVLDGHGTKGT